MRALLPVLSLALAGCISSHSYRPLLGPGRPDATIVVRDVRVFPATSTDVLEHQDVVVADGLVRAVQPTGGALPAGARVIEGQGRTLLPGLVDAHAHLTGSPAPPWALAYPDLEHNLEAQLYAGVTTVYDLAGDPDELAEARKDVEGGGRFGPRILYAGPMLTTRGGYPVSMFEGLFPWPVAWLAARSLTRQVALDEVDGVVGELCDAGASFIKVAYASIPESGPIFDGETLRAVTAAAHRRGRKVLAHVDTAAHALGAARAGVDVLVHGVHLTPFTAEQAQELAGLKTAVVPTLITFDEISRLARNGLEFPPLTREMEPASALAPFSKEAVARADLPPDFRKWVAHLQEMDAERPLAVKRMFDAGVPIVAGSDASGSTACMPGSGLHEELAELAAAGLPNAEVLLAATSRAARLYRDAPDFGTVEAGKAADLLLVEGNPLEDIRATARVAAVIRRGRLLERKVPEAR